MKMSANADKPLTARQLAKVLKINWQTVLRWGRDGIIPRECGGGNYVRFYLSEVRLVMKEKGRPK